MLDQPGLFSVTPPPPKVGVTGKRDHLSKTYFTEEEFSLVSEKAQACGKQVSVYLREAALGTEIKVRKLRHRDAIIRELSLIGTELRHLREKGAEHPKLDAALDEILNLLTKASALT